VKTVVGLGNPGREYEGSRHNAGFEVVARLAQESGIRLRAGRGDFVNGVGRIAGQPVRLVMPLTYMNDSGHAVADVLRQTACETSDLLVICDDVHLELGQLRLRRTGSDGGHNGLASIIRSLGTEDFPRLRLGVGEPPDGIDRVDYVLDRFRDDEIPSVEKMIDDAVRAVDTTLREGVDKTMSIVNRRTAPNGPADPEEAQ
jgi:PTH1 family peptidyl-tRNA hydrolase